MPIEVGKCVVPLGATIRDVLANLDGTGAEVVAVCDGDGRLLGLMTDGDVRRALLGGAELATPIEPFVNATPLTVPPGTGRNDALDLMRARRRSQLPVVNEQGTLVGLHLLHDVITSQVRPNLAVIMAGGRGTRLGWLTQDTPKPMIQVAGRPVMERTLLHLVGEGIHRFAVSVNYLGELIESHFGDGSNYGCHITYLREDPDRPLGTAGSLSLLTEQLGRPEDPILLLNGDVVSSVPAGELLDAHLASGAAATVAIRQHEHQVPFGVVRTVGDRLTDIAEKPTVSWMINSGVYVLSPELVASVAAHARLDAIELLRSCLDRGLPVHAFEFSEDWIDVGTPRDLRRARGIEVDHG